MNKKPSRITSKKEQKQLKQFVDNPDYTKVEMSVVLVYPDRQNTYEQLVPSQTVYLNLDKQIVLERLVDSLRRESFLPDECALSYEDTNRGYYIYCGYIKSLEKVEGTTQNTRVPEQYFDIPFNFVHNNQLKIKVRKSKKGLVESLLEQQKKINEKEADPDTKGAKQKEKKIGQVVEKVALWRRFYTGFYDEKGNYVQKPLEQAATEVGVAKKTLDDYLLQIRCGKKYGFNFNSNVNSKIGQLRAFVRDAKKKQGKQ